ncbi:MAG: hypothetical protein Q7T47_02565 [Anaerolineales bacterium]|nr:hypothetical protein [Anaerolineales bacterium]
MDKFLLRPACAKDSPAIRALIREARINPASLDWRRFIVAVAPKGELIGCRRPTRRPGQASRGWHTRIGLDRGASGSSSAGHGGRIVEQLLTENQPPLYLICRNGLGPFYERFGFRAVLPSRPSAT